MDRGITVLAAAYNGRDYIEEQMDSILAQGQGGILLVVSDDGSSDGTGVLLDRYGLKHRDRVLILHRRTGSGGAAAHFLGLLKMMASLAAGKGLSLIHICQLTGYSFVTTVFGWVPNSKCLCSIILVYGVSLSV